VNPKKLVLNKTTFLKKLKR